MGSLVTKILGLHYDIFGRTGGYFEKLSQGSETWHEALSNNKNEHSNPPKKIGDPPLPPHYGIFGRKGGCGATHWLVLCDISAAAAVRLLCSVSSRETETLEVGSRCFWESKSNCMQRKEHSRIFQKKFLIQYKLYIYTKSMAYFWNYCCRRFWKVDPFSKMNKFNWRQHSV